MYKLIQNSGSIIRLSDGAIIPNALGNRMWDEYLYWLEQGNIPIEPDSQLNFYPQTIVEAKKYIQQLIIENAAKKQEALVSEYSPAERDTWDVKEREAREYLETRDITKCKYLRAEAIAMTGANDEITIGNVTQQLAYVIVRKADQLRLASATISGTRSRKFREVDLIADIKEVLDYKVEEGWSV